MSQRKLIPTSQQWRKWSLPSKLTFLGAALGVLGIGLSLALSRWPLSPSPRPTPRDLNAESPSVLTLDRARAAIEPMIRDFAGMAPMRVISIATPVDGLTAVAIEPPYREFPNVVLFRFDDVAKRWKRVHEALTLGIQFERSPVLDLHTLGMAVDVLQPREQDAGDYLINLGYAEGWVAVPYEQFIHLHPAGRESYHVDKTQMAMIAKQLITGGRPFVERECTLFDVPVVYEISLSHSAGRFVLGARSANNQEWVVTFTGIDGSGHLARKVVRAQTGPS